MNPMFPSEKTCKACGQVKPCEEFYIHLQMKDGRLNKCIDCVKRYMRKHREDNESVRARERARPTRDSAAYQYKWRAANPKAGAARGAVQRAVAKGILVRGPCIVCGKESTPTEPSHAHHHDYEKPLDVEWHCVLHHMQLHHKLVDD